MLRYRYLLSWHGFRIVDTAVRSYARRNTSAYEHPVPCHRTAVVAPKHMSSRASSNY